MEDTWYFSEIRDYTVGSLFKEHKMNLFHTVTIDYFLD
jgi:hypothetical protein